MLLARNLVEEVHVWDFCVDNQTNREFIHAFMNASDRDPRYVLYSSPPDWNKQYTITSRGQGYLWEKYYEHYSTDPRYSDEDILVKADDDIVFLDVNKFTDFVANIKTPNLYFPNIVNNDAGLYVQGQRNVHPNIVRIFKDYEQLGVKFAQRFETYYTDDVIHAHKMPFSATCPISNFRCTLHRTDWTVGLYTRGDQAIDIHESFLENPQQFLTACSGDGDDEQQRVFPRMIPLKQRISVNMFAGRMMLIKQLFATFLDHQCCEDEGFLGKWPSLSHLDHLIDTHFTIVHFAFNPQYKSYETKMNELINRYDDLSLMILKQQQLLSLHSNNHHPHLHHLHHQHHLRHRGNDTLLLSSSK